MEGRKEDIVCDMVYRGFIATFFLGDLLIYMMACCIHHFVVFVLLAFPFLFLVLVGWCSTGVGSAGRRLDWVWLGGLDGGGGSGHGGSLGGAVVFGVGNGRFMAALDAGCASAGCANAGCARSCRPHW